MSWFKRTNKGLVTQAKKELPDGLWTKCPDCGEVLYKKELGKNLSVCNRCDYHFRMPSSEYIHLLTDENTFSEFNDHLKSNDPLKFKDSKKYSDRLKEAAARTGLTEAVRTGDAKLNNLPIVLAVMDFRFIGGSMGSVVGQKVAGAIDRSLETTHPLIIVSASGGARMQEAVLSLMQMAKTSAKLAMLHDATIPYVSILTHPTTGGVTASYSMLGDVILAEPKALIGFAGPRVIKQTIGQDLPKGFQRAEFLLEHGFVDCIVKRKDMKLRLYEILTFFITSPSKFSQGIPRNY
jgi:acetyl-CoA carboxylase carboxyl transferase subunit beta